MKIIIVGCGKVGTTLAEQLNNEHHDITIIDKNTAVLSAITERIDVMGVVGNGAVGTELRPDTRCAGQRCCTGLAHKKSPEIIGAFFVSACGLFAQIDIHDFIEHR